MFYDVLALFGTCFMLFYAVLALFGTVFMLKIMDLIEHCEANHGAEGAVEVGVDAHAGHKLLYLSP